MFVVLVEEPSPECGHGICLFDTLEEAQRGMATMKKEMESGSYWNTTEAKLCAVLFQDEWSCQGR